MTDTTRRSVDSGGVGIVVHESGPADGVPVILLHGWPDSSHLWRNQISPLADAGYRVLVPDMRGFGQSDRPDTVDSYNLLFAIGDVIAVLDDASVEKAHVVGHDWGAAVAWGVAGGVPDRVSSLTAVSVGHPSAFAAAGMTQREKSFYMLLFQFAGIAEQWLSDDDWANMREWAHDPADMNQYIADLSRPGALSASLNWYRANVGPQTLVGPPLALPPAACPTMGVIGDCDFALTVAQMEASDGFTTGEWRYELLEGLDHWIPVDAPDQLNSLLIDWLGAQDR